MSIASVHYNYFKYLKLNNALPEARSILEIGEQNWYGDLDPHVLLNDISEFSEIGGKADLLQEVSKVIQVPSETQAFDIAKQFYKVYFNSDRITSIDLHGTDKSIALDLNDPHDLGEQFDSIFNLGTAEHVFNVYQAFKSMHDWLKVGGRIYHCLPMYGEIDHGFYNFHPTFYWDLAYANNYNVINIAKLTMSTITFAHNRAALSDDILKQDMSKAYGLMVAFEKTNDQGFKTPQQGRYDAKNPDVLKLVDDWRKQRMEADANK